MPKLFCHWKALSFRQTNSWALFTKMWAECRKSPGWPGALRKQLQTGHSWLCRGLKGREETKSWKLGRAGHEEAALQTFMVLDCTGRRWQGWGAGFISFFFPVPGQCHPLVITGADPRAEGKGLEDAV